MTPDLVEKLRSHKKEILYLLALRGWPADALEAVEKFCHLYGRLYPSVRRRGETPQGIGQLVYVDADRSGVLIQHNRQPTYFLSGEVRPVGAPAVAVGFGLTAQ